MSLLNNLTKITTKSAKRLGRGIGSGKARTAGRGQKGYTSRVGSKVPLWFEGGQLPLSKRLPMLRGKSRFNVVRPTAEYSLSELTRIMEKHELDVISLESLKMVGELDKRFKKAKIIATGTLEIAIKVKGLRASKAAQAAIEKAGGTLE